jgi:uncharacterized membrane protein YeaQ/YmgE (transglycosylase-associated protein family)
MPTRSFDVVILGGGNAGMGVTVPTREAGLKVVMIEPDLLGGTCPNRGCMPKKVLVAAAHALDEIARASAHHIAVAKPTLDWAALIDREKAIISGIPGSLADLMTRRGVEVIRERGRFAAPNAIEVGGETVAQLHMATERIGIAIHTEVTVRRVERAGDRLRVVFEQGGSEHAIEAERVVNGAGRVADVDLTARKCHRDRLTRRFALLHPVGAVGQTAHSLYCGRRSVLRRSRSATVADSWRQRRRRHTPPGSRSSANAHRARSVRLPTRPDPSKDREEFLIHEAALLDEWRLEEWLELMAPDARYLVPPLDAPDADHRDTLFLIADDRRTLASRARQLLSGITWAENPRSRTRRLQMRAFWRRWHALIQRSLAAGGLSTGTRSRGELAPASGSAAEARTAWPRATVAPSISSSMASSCRGYCRSGCSMNSPGQSRRVKMPSLNQVIVWIIVGLLGGSLAALIITRERKGFGILRNLAVGLIGALVGGLLFRVLGIFPALDKIAISLRDIVAAVIGSLLVLTAIWLKQRSNKSH